MARTIQEIYNEIIAEKESFSSLDDLVPNPDSAQTFLTDLTTSSKVAIWRSFSWLIAFAIWTHEKLFDVHVDEIEERALELIPGVVRWYVDQSKLFQDGYDLVWDGDNWIYEDTTSLEAVASKVITQASATEVSNELTIKVAKGIVPALEKLSTTQLASFTAYIDQIKVAGTRITIISEDPDYLKVAYTIVYDPLVLNASGVLISDGSTRPVDEAINNYIQSVPFNNDLLIADLTDAVQAAEGVLNAVVTVAEGKYGAIPYVDILATTKQTYSPRAGYMLIDPAFPLTTQITYTT